MRYRPEKIPSVFQLSTLGPIQLKALAKSVAFSHLGYLRCADLAQRECHVSSEHEYGISLSKSASSTLDGLCLRLIDPGFWFRRLSQIAARTAEVVSLRSLAVGRNQPYCSNETFESYMASHGAGMPGGLKKIQRYVERSASQNFLIAKQ